jgi:glycosyltransferase involved in cell wall biosynthesis
MIATIAICTFDRSKLLDKTLSRLHNLDVSGCGEWELLVVNNNCQDDTDTVIERHSTHLPVRRLWEPRPGKSYAANLAVQESRGELILWIDDDVLVERGWMKAYIEAARLYPDVSFFGGPITPWFESKPPLWIARHLPHISYCFATQPAFDEPFAPIATPRLPFGANMGMRRACFDDQCFDVKLGPVGRTNYQDEEIVLLQKLLDSGRRGLWVRDAAVRHFIATARLTEQYLWQFHSCIGRTRVQRGEVRAVAKELFGAPRWLVRKYLVSLAICKLWSPIKNDRWLSAFRRAAVYRGMISELRERQHTAEADVRRSSRNDETVLCRR